MAQINQGILGGVNGKVGTVIGSSWRGIQYVRALAVRSKKKTASEKQQSARARFLLMTAFQQSMREVWKLGFKTQAIRMTELNSALSYNLKNAIKSQDANHEILYPQIQISRGSLPNAGSPTARPAAAGSIQFNWTNNSGTGNAHGNDKALLVAYCAELKQTIYNTGPLRSSESATLSTPAFSGKEVQTWIGFIAENDKDVASSIFTGALAVL